MSTLDTQRQENRNYRDFSLEQYIIDNHDYTRKTNKTYICCPFHTESTPSCLISKYGFYCFGCGEKGNARKLLKELGDESINDVESGNNEYIETKIKVSHIDENYIDESCELLLSLPDKVKYLENRFVDIKTIKAAKIGYVPVLNGIHPYPRFVVPFFNFNKQKIVSARYRIDPLFENENNEPKYISHYGCEQILYNLNCLGKSDSIVIVGSQFDAAFLWYRYNVAAIAPPSENVFKLEWTYLFRNKNVLLWLDNDAAGYYAMVKAYNLLHHICNVKMFNWKKPFKDKDDFTDFFARYGENGLWKAMEHYQMN